MEKVLLLSRDSETEIMQNTNIGNDKAIVCVLTNKFVDLLDLPSFCNISSVSVLQSKNVVCANIDAPIKNIFLAWK